MVRYLLAAAAVGAAALAIGVVASEDAGASESLYLWTYYSDASKTQSVGWSQDICMSGWVSAGPIQGQSTQWYDKERIGLCPGDLF